MLGTALSNVIHINAFHSHDPMRMVLSFPFIDTENEKTEAQPKATQPESGRARLETCHLVNWPSGATVHVLSYIWYTLSGACGKTRERDSYKLVCLKTLELVVVIIIFF